MSKKKPYSKIENAKALRKEQFAYDRLLKDLDRKVKKEGFKIEKWVMELCEDAHVLTEKTIRLGDFLWVRETEDAPGMYTKEAEALGRKYCQLLVRQHKAMAGLLKILDERISLTGLKKPGAKQ